MEEAKPAFARRLNEAFDALGIPQKQKGRYTALAKLFSVTPVAARDWCEGASYPSLEKLVQILQTVRKSADWLLFGRGATDEQLIRPEWIGPSEPAAHEPGDMAFERSWLARSVGSDEVALVAIGSDAMEPTLQRGDCVLIDFSAQSIRDSGLYAFDFPGEQPALVRRILRQVDGAVEVMCDNPAYRSQSVRATVRDGTLCDAAGNALPVRVAGRVVLHLRSRIG